VPPPGARFAVSDPIAEPDMDAAIRTKFEQALADPGLVDVEISETHRVHEHAASAIVRALEPAIAGL
jgi:arsenite methyltransferase